LEEMMKKVEEKKKEVEPGSSLEEMYFNAKKFRSERQS
jgi:hypothetical protein